MHSIVKLIDKTLCGPVDGNIILDPTDIDTSKLKRSISRYNIKYTKYIPYELSYNKMQLLDLRLKFTNINRNKIVTFNNVDTLKLDYSNDSYYLSNPKDIKSLMYMNDITPLGILAILNRSYYDNRAFKDWVETNYLEKNFEYNGMYDLWILNEENRYSRNITLDLIVHLIDLKIGYGVKYYNDSLPYTFKWR